MQIHNNLKENTEQVRDVLSLWLWKYKEKKSDKYTHSDIFFIFVTF